MKLTFCCLALVVGLPLQTAAESNTTNILDGVTTNTGGPFTLGDTGPFNFLLITNGGALTNTVGTIGNSNTAFGNLAIVTGPGSSWANAPTLTIGVRGASNQVSVLDGAKLVSSVAVGVGTYDTSIGNRLLVSGANSRLEADRLFLGTYSADNTFIVEQGAHVGLNSFLTVNSEFSPVGRNKILIGDPGTLVTINGELSVSRSPANLVSVSDGATLAVRSCDLGSLPLGYANRLDISGFNTLLVVSNGLSIGSFTSNNVAVLGDSAELRVQRIDVGSGSSGNELRVANGARVISTLIPNANASLAVGTAASGNANLVTLQDSGTIWTNSGHIGIGSAGSQNTFIISNGAAMFDTIGSFGSISTGGGAGSTNNRLVVTGAGSLLSTRFGITVGGSGSQNSLVLSEGGRLNSSSTDIGQNCIARDNLAFISGAGTVWSNGQLQVGFCSTNNHLVISNGAQVFAGLVRSSVQGGASNTITVRGSGSLLRAAGDLILGNSGTANSLLIADGGRIEGRNDRVAFGNGGHVASLFNAGTSWSNTGLTIGDAASGNHLVVAAGARIDSGGAMLGAGAKSSGNMAMLSGASSAWNVATNLMLGGLGHSNRLAIVRGAAAAARNVYLGAGSMVNPTALFNSDWNSVWIEGSNSVLSASSNVVVGAYGRFNDLEIHDGAQVHDSDGVVGLASGSRSNSVLVSGPGSLWLHTNSLIVGSNGLYNEMTVSAGARVINAGGYLGITGVDLYGGSGCFGALESFSRVSVTGQQSVWENRENLFVGYGAGGNQLTVMAGGTVLANGLTIGRVPGIRNSGSCPPVTNVVVIDGGCLFVTNAAQDALLDPSYGMLIVNRGRVVADRIQLTNGNLSRIELRGGELQILRGRTYTGLPLVVGDGLHGATLQFGRSGERPYLGRLDLGHGVVLRPHGRLMGHGIVVGDITNAGIISAGAPLFGQLSVDGNVRLQPESILHVDIGGVGESEYDSLICDFQGIETSTLRVSLHNGFVPAPTDVFNIITSFRSANGFTNVALGGRVKTADQLGSFLLSNSYPSFVLTDYQSTDLDGDGIEDAWATNHFGHSPLTPAEKLADADGDGVSNYDEFRAGTNPNDPASALKLSIAYAGGGATVSFPCVDGKEYRIWSSNDLETWTAVPDPTFFYPSLGHCEWTDDGKDTGGLGGRSRFYRVTVE